MSFFEDDSFDKMINEFFGGANKRIGSDYEKEIISGEEEDRNMDYTEDDSSVYLVFELSGFNEKDISVEIKGKELIINADKKEGDVNSYLSKKFESGKEIIKSIPVFVKPKTISKTMRNGILEIKFEKKRK